MATPRTAKCLLDNENLLGHEFVLIYENEQSRVQLTADLFVDLLDHGIDLGGLGTEMEKGISLETACPEFSSVTVARRT
jgi:hypothetical protein